MLSSAIPAAPGKWGFIAIAGRQTNVSNNSSLIEQLYGLGLAYGLADRTELDLTYEYGTFSGVPGMELSLNILTSSLKYNLLLEAPLSLAVGASYSFLSQKDNFAGSPSGCNYGVKIVASKVLSSFVPYACLNRTFTSLAGESNATEATLGGMWMINDKWFLMAENTWKMHSAGYTSNMSCFCAGYSM